MIEKKCDNCIHYSCLKSPREVQDGYIYGYCFKFGTKQYHLGMGKGFPVFIKDGVCKDFKKRK